MPEKLVVEWAPFSLREGVEEARLLRASSLLQDAFLGKQRGFIKRELLKGKNGQWVDLVYWESQEAADQAVKNAANSPACFEYFQLMAGADHANPSEGVLHLERAAAYERRPV